MKLCSTFRELDSHFRAAIQRGCDVRSLPPMAQVYDWSLGTGVSESDLADLDAMVSDHKSDL